MLGDMRPYLCERVLMGRFMIAIWAADTRPELPIPGAPRHTPLTCPMALHLLLDREDLRRIICKGMSPRTVLQGEGEQLEKEASGDSEPPSQPAERYRAGQGQG